MTLSNLIDGLSCSRPGCACQQRGGQKVQVHCPAHDDKTPSLSVSESKEGTVLLYCHAGCSQESVISAVKIRGLWPSTASGPMLPDKAARRQDIPAKLKRHIAATYDYVDENGTLIYQVVRWDPKTFTQRRPGAITGTWENNLTNVQHVLYHLPGVLAAAAQSKPIFLAEGEKDADALQALGLCSTCNPMGAGKWEDSYTNTLSGANIVVLPDNDDVGRSHAYRIALALDNKARRVRVVELPGLPEKGDVSDWLEAGGTAETLLTLVRATPDWTPSAIPTTALTSIPVTDCQPNTIASPKKIAQRIIDLADVEPPGDVPILFGSYLLEGATHWLTGQTGIGKSTIVYNIACSLAEGKSLWGEDCKQIGILYVDPESSDSGRALKIERLYLDEQRVRGKLYFLSHPPRFPEDIAELLAFVRDYEISLVIFDTARRCFSVRDENDNAEVYNRIVPVLDALKRAGVATLTLGHPAKNGDGRARGAGAQEDMGDVNLVLAMHKGEISDPDGIVVLRITKNRMLGFGIAPLLLRRIGNDHFERVENNDVPAASETTVSKEVQCGAFLLSFLQNLDEDRASLAKLKTADGGDGFSAGTINRAIAKLKTEGKIEHLPGKGYCLPDPFAD